MNIYKEPNLNISCMRSNINIIHIYTVYTHLTSTPHLNNIHNKTTQSSSTILQTHTHTHTKLTMLIHKLVIHKSTAVLSFLTSIAMPPIHLPPPPL